MRVKWLCFFIAVLSYAETHLPAGSVSGILDLSGSPYYVEGDVYVPEGSTLVISPGCSLMFMGGYSLEVKPGAVLKAIGTPDDSIYFTKGPSVEPFCGLKFNGAENCTLWYCVIEHSKLSGIQIWDGQVVILNSEIRDNNFEGFVGDWSTDRYGGGGIMVVNSELTMWNTRVVNNVGHNWRWCDCFGEYEFCDPMYSHGGGIFFLSSVGFLHNCEIDSNVVEGDGSADGGGIFARNSDVYLFHCQITSNTAKGSSGGGICVVNSHLYCLNCQINYNRSVGGSGEDYWGQPYAIINGGGAIGGGIAAGGYAVLLLENSEIIGNQVVGGCGGTNQLGYPYSGGCGGNGVGGGIYSSDSSTIWLVNSKVIGNLAAGGSGGLAYIDGYGGDGGSGKGGGIVVSGSSIEFINSIVSLNIAKGGNGGYSEYGERGNKGNASGGGMIIEGGSKVTFVNSMLSGNEVEENSRTPIFGDNLLTIGCRWTSKLILFNSVLDHSPEDTASVEGCSLFVASSCVYLDTIDFRKNVIILGSGNIFERYEYPEYLEGLPFSSVCIDAGRNLVYIPFDGSVLYAPMIDIYGNPRPRGDKIDIGPFEADPENPLVVYHLHYGWNLISVPFEEQVNFEELFPSYIYPAYKIDNILKNYIPKEYSEPGNAFWVFSVKDTYVVLDSLHLIPELVDTLYPGWNLIGAPSVVIDVREVVDDPAISDSVFMFDPVASLYKPTVFIRPTFGYWVFCTDTLVITLP